MVNRPWRRTSSRGTVGSETSSVAGCKANIRIIVLHRSRSALLSSLEHAQATSLAEIRGRSMVA